MFVTVRSTVKSVMPLPLRTGLRRALTYTQRLMTWAWVMASVRGLTAADQRALNASCRAALRNSARDLDVWCDPILLSDLTSRVEGIGIFRLRAQSDDLYHVLPRREYRVLEALDRYLQPGDVFVDAGANIGFFTVAAARRIGAAGRIVAVEMMPDTAQALRDHLSLNGVDNAVVIERALSDRAGAHVEATVRDGHFGQATIALASTQAGGRQVRVETTTLADALAGLPTVAVLKIDIEGAELDALRGAGSALQRVKVILFEQLDSSPEVPDHLKSMGFEVSSLDGRNRIAVNRDAGPGPASDQGR
jgi:FkbM family methyltransferase